MKTLGWASVPETPEASAVPPLLERVKRELAR
jgi:hypothetical protein